MTEMGAVEEYMLDERVKLTHKVDGTIEGKLNTIDNRIGEFGHEITINTKTYSIGEFEEQLGIGDPFSNNTPDLYVRRTS